MKSTMFLVSCVLVELQFRAATVTLSQGRFTVVRRLHHQNITYARSWFIISCKLHYEQGVRWIGSNSRLTEPGLLILFCSNPELTSWNP